MNKTDELTREQIETIVKIAKQVERMNNKVIRINDTLNNVPDELTEFQWRLFQAFDSIKTLYPYHFNEK